MSCAGSICRSLRHSELEAGPLSQWLQRSGCMKRAVQPDADLDDAPRQGGVVGDGGEDRPAVFAQRHRAAASAWAGTGPCTASRCRRRRSGPCWARANSCRPRSWTWSRPCAGCLRGFGLKVRRREPRQAAGARPRARGRACDAGEDRRAVARRIARRCGASSPNCTARCWPSSRVTMTCRRLDDGAGGGRGRVARPTGRRWSDPAAGSSKSQVRSAPSSG